MHAYVMSCIRPPLWPPIFMLDCWKILVMIRIHTGAARRTGGAIDGHLVMRAVGENVGYIPLSGVKAELRS